MKLELGKEYIPANEEALIKKFIPLMKKGLAKKYPPGGTKRFFHPKMHGCLKGEFIIEPGLPEKLKEGLFAKPASYQAWIRFSSANPKIKDDRKKNYIGAAIKLVGVPGQKEMAYSMEEEIQDFLLVSKSTLAAANLLTIFRTVEALTGNIFNKLFFAVRYFWRIVNTLLTGKHFTNVLETQFWSQTPYRYGKEDLAVKYTLRPQKPTTAQVPGTTPEFLRERLASDLSASDHYFDFMVQFQEDADTMPMEDPSKEWKSQFQKVATLKIPKQEFNNAQRDEFGENLSYNPWHTLTAHKPLSAINRARKEVYQALAEFRHERNNTRMTEPSSTKAEAL